MVECCERHALAHLDLDTIPVSEIAIVHEDVATEVEGMGIPSSDGGTGDRSADVREDCERSGVLAERGKVRVCERLADDLVDRGATTTNRMETFAGGIVPIVHVELTTRYS